MPRRPGRPSVERERMERALAGLGTSLRDFLLACDRDQDPSPAIADKLYRATGVRVHHRTVLKWLWRYQHEGMANTHQQEALT